MVKTELKKLLNTVGHSASGTTPRSLFFNKILLVSEEGDISFQNFLGLEFSKDGRSCEKYLLLAAAIASQYVNR